MIKSIAFVCLGNICRSPTAEAVMKDILEREEMTGIEVSSFCTSSWHIGSLPDNRAIAEGQRRGVILDSKAQQLTYEDAKDLDLILVMDQSNYTNVSKIIGEDLMHKVFYLGSFEPGAESNAEITDTYYGDAAGFAAGYEHIARSCEGLLTYIKGINQTK